MLRKIFTDILEKAYNPTKSLGQGVSNVASMQIGEGAKAFKGDKDGIWLGAEKFADAPYKVDVDGNATATSISISGYVADGGAAADINLNIPTVTGTKITSNSITSSQIAANTITASEIQANTITAGEIAGNTITASEINSNTITSSEIASNTITASEIQASTITATEMNVATLSAISADMGSITAGTVTGALIRTAASGSRVEIVGADNEMAVYSGSTKIIQVDEGGMWVRNDNVIGLGGTTAAGQAAQIYRDSSNVQLTIETTNASESILINSGNAVYLSTDGNLRVGITDSQVNFNVKINMNDLDIESIDELKGDDGYLDMNSGNGNTQTHHFDPSSSNSYNLGGSSRYWSAVNTKDLTKYSGGTWGFFDKGVEMPNGKILPDTEALLAMEEDTETLTSYGATSYKHESLPKAIQVLPKDKDGKVMKKDSDGEYYQMERVKQKGTDGKTLKDKNGKTVFKKEKVIHDKGENVFATISILLGAVKELTLRVKDLEGTT